jgi:hypothetical protein
MAKLSLAKGTTSYRAYVFVQDSSVTTGAGKTGLAYNTAGLVAYYVRPGASATAITLATQTVTGAYASGGFVEVDGTNMPGVYRLDVPDAALASGVNAVIIMLKGAANMAPVVMEIELTGVDNQNATTGGLANLDAAITSRLAPTTAGRTLDVTATGAAGVDWGNIENPTTAVNLSGTNIDPDQVVASVSGAVGSVTGNVGGNVTGSVGSIAGGGLTAASIAADAFTAAKFAADVTAEFQSGLSTLTAAPANTEADTALADVGLTTTITGRIDAAISTRATPAQVNTEVDAALADARLDELLAADSDIDGAAPPVVGSVFHELLTKTAGSFTYDQSTDSLEAIRDRGDAGWTTATGFSTLDAAGVRGAVGLAAANLDTQLATIDGIVDAILVDTGTDIPATLGSPAGASLAADIAATLALTDDIGVAGAGLTALPWNAAWDAEVQSEVADALTAYDPPTKAELDSAVAPLATAASLTTLAGYVDTEVGAIKGVTDKLDTALELDGAVYRYTTNALEQAPSGATVPAIVDGVWDATLTDHLDSGSTGAALNAAGAAGDPWSTALPGAYGAGTAGKLIGENVNAAIGSRATQASIDAILTDTNELQADWADGGRLDLLLDARATQVSVTAIQAKTDALPASPAATGDIPTAAQNADALLDRANGIEVGLTPRQALRLIAAALAGELSGAATTTITIRNAVAGSKDRIVATVDPDGNRSALVYDLS